LKDWTKISRQAESSHTPVERLLAEKLTGLGINIHHISDSIHHLDLNDRPTRWSEDDMMDLARSLRRTSKPMIIAANKADKADDSQIEALKKAADNFQVIPTCSEAEMALRKADKAGLIAYLPGSSSFEIRDESKLNKAQLNALEKIRDLLERFGSTNVQKVLEEAAYDLLDLIVVYPVEDEHHYTDHNGRVLPDAHLLRKGSTARDLAYKVHTDLGDHFIRAIDCRTQRTIGADHELKKGDVVKIHSNA
jgi:ribosome-binding ATPase YchF (GTP1/OBG family)